MNSHSGPTIDDVRSFWDANPLWTGEGAAPPASRDFFNEHRSVYLADCFAGRMDERIFPDIPRDARVLDLGCGIGFWLVEFWERGFRNIVAADLSSTSLEIARKRCDLFGVEAEFSVQNAEATTFPRESFDHVNCQGVIHHTPSTEAALAEIAAILKPGGTASVSVYFRNALIRNWKYVRPISHAVARLGGGLKGRGRHDMLSKPDVDDIVRRYDGAQNPIGRAYSVADFEKMADGLFEIEAVYGHFFPARALPVPMPRFLHRQLDQRLPFMVYFNLRKPG